MKLKDYYKYIGIDPKVPCLMGCKMDREITIEDCIIDYLVLKNFYAATLHELCWHREGQPDKDGDYVIAYRLSDGSVEYGWAVWEDGAWDVMCDFNPDTDEIQGWKKMGWYGG